MPLFWTAKMHEMFSVFKSKTVVCKFDKTPFIYIFVFFPHVFFGVKTAFGRCFFKWKCFKLYVHTTNVLSLLCEQLKWRYLKTMTHFLSCIYIYTGVPVMCLSLSVLLKMLNMLLCKKNCPLGKHIKMLVWTEIILKENAVFECIWINVDVA